MISGVKDVLDATSGAFVDDPSLAAVRIEVEAELREACAVDVRIGDRSVSFDMPQPLGGGDGAPSPGQVALAALGACQAITYRIWSEHLGIRIDALHVVVDGDVDVRGLLGVPGGGRAGFDQVEVQVRVTGPERAERYGELRQAVEAHCPVLDAFTGEVPVSTSLALVDDS